MAEAGTDNLRILGIDPGLIITGYGLIDVRNGEPTLLEGGVIRIPTKLPLEQRLATIFLGLQELPNAEHLAAPGN